ncbi:unnamed protein product [Trichobilharzia szidati]|nr:unnamed protein product [Trichobilharzia szidati]
MSLNFSNVQVSREIKFPPDECSIHVKNMEHAVGFLRGYISPIIVLFGVFGNMSAFYLFLTHKPFNRFSIYVMTLAISDSLVLISNTFLDDFLGRGLYYLTNERIMIKLDTYSLTSCRIMELIGCWFVFNSGCLLVAFSIDRVNCLFWPLRCRSDGGIGIATLACSFIIVIGFILSIPYAMLQKLTDKTSSLPSSVDTTINTTTTTFYANISSTGNITANNDMQMYNLYSFNCSNCTSTHHIEMPMKRESKSL